MSADKQLPIRERRPSVGAPVVDVQGSVVPAGISRPKHKRTLTGFGAGEIKHVEGMDNPRAVMFVLLFYPVSMAAMGSSSFPQLKSPHPLEAAPHSPECGVAQLLHSTMRPLSERAQLTNPLYSLDSGAPARGLDEAPGQRLQGQGCLRERGGAARRDDAGPQPVQLR